MKENKLLFIKKTIIKKEKVEMKIAIFADIHGKVLLPFKLVDYYQKITGEKIDLILQCGDVGIFPDLNRLDKATAKHAEEDRDELGFYDQFTRINVDIRAYLDELNIDMLCVRGNHEDHDYLNEIEERYGKESIYPVDAYQRVWMFRSGCIHHFESGNESIDIIGIGRIGDEDRKTEQRFIQNYERKQIKKLIDSTSKADILITHDKSCSSKRGYGLPEIGNVLDNVWIPYHFYGHTGEVYHEELDKNGITTSVKIRELEFGKMMLPLDCMVILDKQDENMSIKTIDRNILSIFTRQNWKNVTF